MDGAGTYEQLREKHQSLVARMTPSARHQAFPHRYPRQMPREAVKVAVAPKELSEVDRLKAEIERLKGENSRLIAERDAQDNAKREPAIGDVMEAFCAQMNAAGFSVGDEPWSVIMLKSSRKAHALSHPRHVCMWLVRTICSGPSFPVIARNFGGRDHTSIMHGIRHAPALLDARPDLLAVATAVLRSFGVVLARLEKGGRPWGAA